MTVIAVTVILGINWSWGPVAPIAKSSRATAVIGDAVVTVGGTFWETTKDEKKIKHWLASVYKLDTRKMTWSRLPDYPYPAGYAYAAAVGSKLYVVGGRGARRGNAETFIMDMSAKQPKWIPGPALDRPRWGLVGGVIGKVIYIAAGEQGDPSKKGAVKRSTQVLALDTSKLDKGWTQVADLPNPKLDWPTATTCGDKLYLFGGMESQADGLSIPVADAFSLNVSTGRWKKLRAMPAALGSGAATAVGDKNILVCGGIGLAATGLQTPDGKIRTYIGTECLLYDVSQDTYKILTPLKQGVLDQGLVHVNGTIISMGGEDSPYKSRSDLVQVGKLRWADRRSTSRD